MLSRIGTRVTALAAALVAVFLAGPLSPAAAQTDCRYSNGQMICSSTDPGSGGSSGGTQPGEVSFTPGPQICHSPRFEDPIPCNNGSRDWWNVEKECYVSVATPQRAKPAGSAETGAWYTCNSTIVPPDVEPFLGNVYQYWSDSPPPGIQWYSPEQAARTLVASWQFSPVSPGIAPPAGVAEAWTSVGFQMWMWVENPQPLSYGPFEETATLGGVTITARAATSLVEWNMGNGDTVNCGRGTVPPSNATINDVSPDCGYVYTRTGDFTITPTSYWVVDWSGGGESGQIRFAITGDGRSIEVGQLQSVNVPVNP